MMPSQFVAFIAPKSTKRLIYFVVVIVLFLMALPFVTLISVTNLVALSFDNSAPSSPRGVYIFTDPAVKEDLYEYGYCTYWSSLRRLQIGQPIPNTWGDAHTWADRAIRDGFVVDQTPSPGAVMQTDRGELGHVAFVESVNPVNGQWVVSEMNSVGWDEVDQKTMPASAALKYNFIHEKILP
ncbi:MAG: hypothetical protein NVSMB46_03620 [Candidatus Saccharimonadales bacterium]